MYAIIPQQIPQDRRAGVNEKILFAIDSGKDPVSVCRDVGGSFAQIFYMRILVVWM